MKSPILLLCAGLFSLNAFADDLVKADCKEPVIPIPQASDVVVKYFNKHVDAYKACLSKFIDDQHDVSKNSTDVAKANAAHDAAENATKQYNDFMAKLNERNGHIDQADDSEGDKK